MTLYEYTETKNSLKALYDSAEQELKSFSGGWPHANVKDSEWMLSFVGIRNDGGLVAVVHWFDSCKKQWVGICWENVTERIKNSKK